MDSTCRIPDSNNWPQKYLDKIFNEDALDFLRGLPDECIALAITSPPYWNVKDYEHPKQIGLSDYEKYLNDLLKIWKETERVLVPNGKLAIVTPIMPIPKKDNSEQHTRHLKNINNDIERLILESCALQRYGFFVWQKQTSVKMFGSYPYPPNIYEDNTVEFINVLVKPGCPPQIPKKAKEASRLTQDQWRNLTMQVWPVYPADVKRSGGHPAPFPVVIPQRLIMMYSFKSAPEAGFEGDIVLDMFNGTGATCVAAKELGRRYIGIDLNPKYCQAAKDRLKHIKLIEYKNPPILLEPVRVTKARSDRQLDFFQDPIIDKQQEVMDHHNIAESDANYKRGRRR